MTDIERITKVAQYAGISFNKLAKEIGLTTPQSFYDIKAGKHGISKELADKIQAKYLNLSMAWLLTGEGEMLKGEAQYVDYEEVREDRRMVDVALLSENDDIEVDIKGLMAECKASARDIATTIGEEAIFVATYNGKLKPRHILALQKRYGDTLVDKYAKYPKMVKAEVIEAIPMLPTSVATEPEQNIREYIEKQGSELERVDPTQLLKHADFVEKILHTSMFPTFQPEDRVFISLIDPSMEIVDGNTYYIDSRRYPTLIRRVKVLPDNKLRLIAQNKQFDDIIMDRADIYNMGAIVGLLRMNFGNQYDEMEELRRKKDSHLERMMELLERSTEQQGQLISHITKDK